MYRKLLNTIAILSLLILQGCASSDWKSEDAGIQTKTVSTKKLLSLTSTVTELPDGFSIYGFVRKQRYPAPKLKGHIDIDILDSKDQILRTYTAELDQFGRWRHAYIKYKYKANILQIPPKDSIVRVSYHDVGIH